MKQKVFKVVLVAFCVTFSVTAFSQLIGQGIGLSGNSNSMIAFTARGGLKLPNMENVDGSPYLDNEYHPANIRTKSGFDTSDVKVKFNVYGNEFIFVKNGVEYALDDFYFLSYPEIKNGEVKERVFQSGFPSIGSFNDNTIYEVLKSGVKFSLLKHMSKRLEDVKTMGEYNKKEFVSKSEYYVFSAKDDKIQKLKADKKSIIAMFPDQEEKIKSIIDSKDLSLKKEADLIILFEELNK